MDDEFLVNAANGSGTRLRLVGLDQIADALRVGFAMAMAGDGIRAAGGFDANLRPEHSCRDMHRSDFRHGDGFVVAAEPARLYAAYAQRADHNAGGKKKISLGNAAGSEKLRLWLRLG